MEYLIIGWFSGKSVLKKHTLMASRSQYHLKIIVLRRNVKIMYRSIPKPPMPPPGQTPGHLTFLKNFGQIPRHVASLDGQMPYPLELQRGSNPPPSRHVKANCGNKYYKIFSHYEFLVQFVFAPHFKQRHIPRHNHIKRQQQKTPRGIDKSNDPSTRLTC